MWANTGEGGEIENPELDPPLENILKWCQHPAAGTRRAEEQVKIGFEAGAPVSLERRGVRQKGSHPAAQRDREVNTEPVCFT
jgi:argininosuccinate synthase